MNGLQRRQLLTVYCLISCRLLRNLSRRNHQHIANLSAVGPRVSAPDPAPDPSILQRSVMLPVTESDATKFSSVKSAINCRPLALQCSES